MVDGAKYIEVLERALVDLIRSELKSGRTQTDLSNLLGIPQRTISSVAAGGKLSLKTLKSGVGSEFFRQCIGSDPAASVSLEDRRWARIAARLRAILPRADALILIDELEGLGTDAARHEAILHLSGTPPPKPTKNNPETAEES